MSVNNFSEACSAVLAAIPSGKEHLVARDFIDSLLKEFQKRDKEIAKLREEIESLKAT